MAGTDDPHDLGRFQQAQEDDYEQALSEITNGRKRSHWMWYIFPQIDGLGFSSTARHYAIKSLDEARAYLAHPVLGPRLLDCAEAVVRVEGRSATGDLRLTRRPEAGIVRHAVRVRVAPRLGVRPLAREILSGSAHDRTLQLLGISPSPEATGEDRRG